MIHFTFFLVSALLPLILSSITQVSQREVSPTLHHQNTFKNCNIRDGGKKCLPTSISLLSKQNFNMLNLKSSSFQTLLCLRVVHITQSWPMKCKWKILKKDNNSTYSKNQLILVFPFSFSCMVCCITPSAVTTMLQPWGQKPQATDNRAGKEKETHSLNS